MTVEQKAKEAYFAHDFARARRWNIYLDGYTDGYFTALDEVVRFLNKFNDKRRNEGLYNLIKLYGNEGCEQKEEEAGNGNLPANQRI